MKNFKLFGVLHFADIMWILLLLALIPAAVRFSVPREVGAHTGDTLVRFTIELGERAAEGVMAPREGFHENIRIGQPIFDSSVGTHLGTIVDVYALPFETAVYNENTGRFRQTTVEGLEFVYIVVEASVNINDYETLIGNFPISVGRAAFVRSKDFAGAGYIISMERVR